MPYAHFTYTVTGQRVVCADATSRAAVAQRRLQPPRAVGLHAAVQRRKTPARVRAPDAHRAGRRRARAPRRRAYREPIEARRTAPPRRPRYQRCSYPSIRTASPRSSESVAPGAPARTSPIQLTRTSPSVGHGRLDRARDPRRPRRSTARSLRRPSRRAATGGTPSSAATSATPACQRQRAELDVQRPRRWRGPRCAASVASPSERSIIACTPAPPARGPRAAAASARARARAPPRAAGVRAARPSSTASAAPAAPRRPGHADEVSGARAVAADERLGAVRPADGGDRDGQHGRGDDVAAGDRRVRSAPRARRRHAPARARAPRRSPAGRPSTR